MDVAIEYQAKLLEVKKIIETLNDIGIKGQKYLKKINDIEETVKKEIEEKESGVLSKNNTIGIYATAISNLELLKNELHKYNVYIEGYYYCNYLENKIKGENISDEKLSLYSKEIVQMMVKINNSDTRYYEEEKLVVENIYSLAYRVMKLEFKTFGKSSIFDAAKANPTMESFVNDEIRKNIEELPKDIQKSRIVKQSMNNARRQGINHSYMDKILITFLALNDDSTIIDDMKGSLTILYDNYTNNSNEINKLKKEIERNEDNIDICLNELKDNKKGIFKEVFKRINTVLVSLAMIFGSYKAAKAIATYKTYKTTKETYSSAGGYSTDVSYEEEKDSEDSLYLYKCEPYEEKDSDIYQRKVESYDISNVISDSEKLENYINVRLIDVDVSTRNEKTEDKKHDEMSEEDFYDDVMYEIVRTIQDKEDIQLKTNVGLAIGLGIVFGIFSNGIWLPLNILKYKKYSSKDIKDDLNQFLLDLKNKIETYRRLIDNNKEVKERFSKAYETYKPLLESTEFKEELSKMSEVVSIEDPQIELDRRKQKILKRVKNK